MPRPPNTDERRAQIAAALIHVMARRGYDGASIAEIGKAAGLTPGLVHYHFENKQEILLEALDALVTRHDQRLDARLEDAPPSPSARVAAFVDFHVGLGTDADPDALACWVLLSGEALRQPEVRVRYAKAVARWVARLRAVIEQGVRSRDFDRMVDGAEAASAIVAAIQGYFVLAAAAREVIPKGSAARSVLAMAEGLLVPKTPLPRRTEGVALCT